MSVIFLIAVSLAFLDIHHSLPAGLLNMLVVLQFIPSVFKFFNTYTLISTGFIIVLLSVLLFGRVYCSSVCPIGIIQDFSSHLSKRTNRRKKYRYTEEARLTRYSVLIIVIITYFSGSILLISLLDPYSNAGRIFSQLFSPLLILGNNLLSSALTGVDIYYVYPVEIKNYSFILALFPLLFLITLIYLSYKRGRLYCNTICPLGTLLGLLSKLSLYKLKIDKSGCEGCGICEKVCKSECIDFASKEIDFSRCVACYNCVDVCPSEVISYQRSFLHNTCSVDYIDESKRNFIARTVVFWSGISAAALSQVKIVPEKQSTVPVTKNHHCSPPGSGGLDSYNLSCTACQLCVSACPTKVLQPSMLQFGISGFLQPYMDYKTSFCNYDCVACIEVCPSGAIKPVSVEMKKKIQIGKAVFVKENCIVETEKKACGACSEHCPTKAVDMVAYKGDLKIPEVTNKYCVGCGACEYACPTIPYKAIYVDGNFLHQTAEKNKQGKIEVEENPDEAFPF